MTLVIFFACMLVIERISPRRSGYTNLQYLHTLTSDAIFFAFGSALIIVFEESVKMRIGNENGSIHHTTWLSILIVFIGLDFFDYWVHRMLHLKALFRFHALHHSTRLLCASSAVRHNPMAHFVLFVPEYVFAQYFSIANEWAIVRLVGATFSFVIHSNTDLPLSWLEWLLNTPRLHAIHHGSDSKYFDRNFGSVLSVWDRLFGTLYICNERTIRFGLNEATPLKSWDNQIMINLVNKITLHFGKIIKRASGG